MSSNMKQVANVTRRTWDVATYNKKAQDRIKQQVENEKGGTGSHRLTTTIGTTDDNKNLLSKEEFIPAPTNAIGPEGSDRAYLKARQQKVSGIDDKIGATEILAVTALSTTTTPAVATTTIKDNDTNVVQKTGIGWHCTICDCYLKDSHTYLDHINGRKHQRALGYGMQVEHSTKEQLLVKLNELTKQQQDQQHNLKDDDEPEDYHEMVRKKDEEEKIRKQERQKQRKERKRKLKLKEQQGQQTTEATINSNEINEKGNDVPSFVPKTQQGSSKQEHDDDNKNTNYHEDDNDCDYDDTNDGGVDPAMAAMMGFTGFGSTSR